MPKKVSEITQLLRCIVFLGSASLAVALLCLAYSRTLSSARKPMVMLQMIWPGHDDRGRFYKAARELGSDVMYEDNLGDSDLYDSDFDEFSPSPEYYPSMSPRNANIEQDLEQMSPGSSFAVRADQGVARIPYTKSRVIAGMNTFLLRPSGQHEKCSHFF